VTTLNGRTKGWWAAEKAASIARDPWLAGLDVIDRRMKTASANAKFKANLLWIVKRFVSEIDETAGFDVRTASADDICDYARGLNLCNKLSMSVRELNLSKRARNCLLAAGIKTLSDLVPKYEEDLLALRSFGKTSLREVQRELQAVGLALGTPQPEGWVPDQSLRPLQ